VRGGCLTPEDRELLGFLAEHRLALEGQLERLLGVGPGRLGERLRALAGERYLTHGAGFGTFRFCQILRRGLDAIGSELPAPRLRLSCYRHDVGVAWLWLAARRGAFGSLAEVLGERRLRSHDGVRERPAEPLGVRLGGLDRHGGPSLHYPDLLLIDPRRRRIALELELTGKSRGRRERILGGYAADERLSGVVYLVEQNAGGRGIGRLIEGSARRMDLTDRVAVQPIKPIIAFDDEASPRSPRRARAADRRIPATGRGGVAR
jgi:hypothetical protein